ncbi:penicillin-binding protein [Stenotrophomonas daejeonensis]|uniref:Peptidoglycan D,D-transpeptidase MrdA n=1 Tax=Stenotrophomonas daejeonensis TaxID=659018 RepID=A0A0R0DQM8_9GAMM|nr:penicillin-binding protein 2 [Stenotrophomonas daejeonensis]KRG84300.1 penicillin-binding protein [Stenotrophomonas daejeonensis]
MHARRQQKNPHAEVEQFRRRAALGFFGVLLGLGVLGGWYFKLQVLDHDVYVTRSEANRIKARPVVPGRGLIYDRNGKLLAENVPAFRVDVTPNKVEDMAATLAGLREVFSLGDEDIERFNQSRKARRSFVPVTLKLRVSEEEMARFAVDRWRYPGVELEPYLTRRYPYGDLLAHVIGYVGRVDDKDLQELGEGNAALTHIGKSGLERYYERELRGKVGYEQVETNVQGRAIRTVGRVPAQSGTDLRLSIDIDLQRAMVEAFGEQEGSAVAIDPRSGEILAMVSLPSFDPNLFVNGISHADFNALNENPSRPQFNRLVLGGVAPGSTVKPFLGLAGLDSGLRRPEDKILSRGMFYLPGVSRGWGDANRGGHGWTDLRKSIAQSVNTYYYQLGIDMGVERYDEYMGGRYGFGQPTGIDLLGEIDGILPSPAAKHKLRNERWYPGDMVNASIGQGLWKVTPLQLVRGVGGLATGQLRRPHLVVEQRVRFDHDWAPLPQPAAKPISPNPSNLRAVQEGMMATMQPGGSGWRVAADAAYRMAGKTGTAQVVSRKGTAAVNPKSLPMHLRHRALFIGFAPAEAPEIAIAIAVEGGGYGGSAAAPIARKVFDAWLLGAEPETGGPAPAQASSSPPVVAAAPAVADTPQAGAPVDGSAGSPTSPPAADAAPAPVPEGRQP